MGRGGGSVEELWAFNEEIVARAVAASEIPVISAVGHETDFTICDFAADLRAPTPSAAAELAVPDSLQQREMLESFRRRISNSVCDRISGEAARVKFAKMSLQRHSPQNYIDDLRVRCDKAVMAMESSVSRNMALKSKEFSSLCEKLDALSPLKIFARGYGAVVRQGKIISDVNAVERGETIDLILSNGTLECEVKDIKNG